MLKKDEILFKTNKGLDVFRHFVSCEWKISLNFKNPFYEDKNASCSIYLDKKAGVYKIKDFGDERFQGDCFSLVGTLYNLDCRDQLDFNSILEIINLELNLNIPNRNSISHKSMVHQADFSFLPREQHTNEKAEERKESPPDYQIKPFSNKESDYWLAYKINESVLIKYKVVSLESFSGVNKDGKPYTIKSTVKEPAYSDLNEQFIKVYRPFSTQRFLYFGIKPEGFVFGMDQLPARGDILFITGGEKDVMSLSANGFFAICFNSETANIPTETIKKLSYRFKHIVLLYDVDATGNKAAHHHLEQLKTLDVKMISLPLAGSKEEKDISDYFRLNGSAKKLKEMFTTILIKLYSETFSMLKPCEIDFNNPPEIPEALIKINEVTIGSAGNLLGITGGEGTGKTNFLGALIAGAMVPAHCSKKNCETLSLDNGIIIEGDIDTLGVYVKPNTNNKAILYYDTEQSEDQLYNNLKKVMKRSGQALPPIWFKGYCLTHLSRQERLKVIIQSMDKFHHEFGGIQLVVIDGIGDLIRSLNDESDSIWLIEELHRLAGIYKTCIICVLHLVPNGIKLRGHLGSELQRKSAGILCVEKEAETDISFIKALKVRSGSPLDVPLLQFAWDKEKDYHVFIGEKSPKDKQARKVEDLQSLADELFAEHEGLSYSDMVKELVDTLEVSIRTAKYYIGFMLKNYIIIKHPISGLLLPIVKP